MSNPSNLTEPAATAEFAAPPAADGQCRQGDHGYGEHREELLARLRRIEGQVRGLQRMIENDRYCIDILTQMSAVQAALNRVGLTILSGHTKSCVTAAARHGDEDAKIEELMAVIKRFIR